MNRLSPRGSTSRTWPAANAAFAFSILLAACSSPQEQQWQKEQLLNQKRIEDLKRGHDSLTKPREVVFWSRVKNDADAVCLEAWLKANQYTMSFKAPRPEGNPALPVQVEFTRSLVPTPDVMNGVTKELITASVTCQGAYQEWESPVVP